MSEQISSQRAPGDLASPGLSPDDCFIWDSESDEFGIQRGDRPRATAISNFAREVGVRFRDVVCRRGYLRLLTRQESYEAGADADNAEDDAAWDWANAQGYSWRDDAFRDEQGAARVPPAFDRTVPPDWEPNEDTPVWEFCERDTPGAIACWRLESTR